MPIIKDYECNDCGYRKEYTLPSMTAFPNCTKCGSSNLEKIFSPTTLASVKSFSGEKVRVNFKINDSGVSITGLQRKDLN